MSRARNQRKKEREKARKQSHEAARAEVTAMIEAGEIDPESVYDDGETVTVRSDWEFSPGLREELGIN